MTASTPACLSAETKHLFSSLEMRAIDLVTGVQKFAVSAQKVPSKFWTSS